MPYKRKEYEKYLNENGIYGTGPYCSYLEKIEKMLGVDIDKEYDADKCEGLQQTLLELRGKAADDPPKHGQIKNMMSKLNKYCRFRSAPEQPEATGFVEKKVRPDVIPPIRHIPDKPEEAFFFNTNGMTNPMEAFIWRCKNFKQFEEQYLAQFLSDENRAGNYLEKLLWKYDKKQATVSEEAGLSRSYVGNIVNGRINDPSRDVLIAICLVIGTTIDEIQYLLRYSGKAPLYVRNRRDVIIWFGFMKHMCLMDVNEELYDNGCAILETRKNASDSST